MVILRLATPYPDEVITIAIVVINLVYMTGFFIFFLISAVKILKQLKQHLGDQMRKSKRKKKFAFYLFMTAVGQAIGIIGLVMLISTAMSTSGGVIATWIVLFFGNAVASVGKIMPIKTNNSMKSSTNISDRQTNEFSRKISEVHNKDSDSKPVALTTSGEEVRNTASNRNTASSTATQEENVEESEKSNNDDDNAEERD